MVLFKVYSCSHFYMYMSVSAMLSVLPSWVISRGSITIFMEITTQSATYCYHLSSGYTLSDPQMGQAKIESLKRVFIIHRYRKKSEMCPRSLAIESNKSCHRLFLANLYRLSTLRWCGVITIFLVYFVRYWYNILKYIFITKQKKRSVHNDKWNINMSLSLL